MATYPLWSHDFKFTEARLTIADGRFRLEIVCDLDPLALGAPKDAENAVLAASLRALSDPEFEAVQARLVEFLQRRIRLRFDDQVCETAVNFPELEAGSRQIEALPVVFGTSVLLSGNLPAGAETVSFFASRAFPPVHLVVKVEGRPDPLDVVLGSGETSAALALGGLARGKLAVFGQYLYLGWLHIVPRGLDHILFVVALFLFSTRWQSLLWQISVFTLAHTLTLGLSSIGTLALSSRLVEPLIAISIVYVAIENLAVKELKVGRLLIVFGFGLLHGLGFAGVLGELGLPKNHFVSALLAFNIGVELGQVTVILLAFAVLGWFRKHAAYRKWVVLPGSILIGLIGLYWTITRVF